MAQPGLPGAVCCARYGVSVTRKVRLRLTQLLWRIPLVAVCISGVLPAAEVPDGYDLIFDSEASGFEDFVFQ